MPRLGRDERRQALVAATLALVEREGVARASSRAIVAEAGMPLGSLHYAFDSHEALISAAVDAVADGERLATSDVLAAVAPGSGVREALAAGLARYVALLAEQPRRELAFLELTLHAARGGLDAGRAPLTYRHGEAELAEVLGALAHRCGVAWTREVDAVARLAVTMLDGITTTWLASHDTARALEAADFHAAALATLTHPLEDPTHAR